LADISADRKKNNEKEIVISTLSESAEYYFKISKKHTDDLASFLIVKKNWHGSTSFVLDHDK